MAVFKDEELEQEVLLRRRSRAFSLEVLPRPPLRERAVPQRPKLSERLTAVIDALREPSLVLGQLPTLKEAPESVLESLARLRVAWPNVLQVLEKELSKDEAYADAAHTRREDLLVHIALQQFPGSPKYRSLPRSLQADIRAFFGKLSAAQAEGRRLLFAAGDRAGIRSDAEAAICSGLGGLRGRANFRFHSSLLARLSPRLRVLVGCAEVLQGGAVACDFVDVDLVKARVAMISCDDIESEVPFVTERVKVDLGRLKVHSERYELGERPIYFKSRFLPADFSGRDQQLVCEAALMETGLFQADAPEPKWNAVMAALSAINTAQ